MSKKLLIVATVCILPVAAVTTFAEDQKATKEEVAAATAAWDAVPASKIIPAAADFLASENGLSSPHLGIYLFSMPETAPAYATLQSDHSPLISYTQRVKLSQGTGNAINVSVETLFRDSIPITQTIPDGSDKNHNTIMVDGQSGLRTSQIILDKSGLIRFYQDGVPKFLNNGATILAHFLNNEFRMVRFKKFESIPINLKNNASLDSSKFQFVFMNYYEGSKSADPDDLVQMDISFQVDGNGVIEKNSFRRINDAYAHNKKYYTVSNEPERQFQYIYSNDFGMYISTGFYDGVCLSISCYGKEVVHQVVDYKPENGQWRSKLISAALPPEMRQQANALFASGFDSYKAGDFIAATALMNKGLAIDPANYIAHFTLAEIARSKFANDPSNSWLIFVALSEYRRTVELSPPDTLEAIKAQAHIDARGIK